VAGADGELRLQYTAGPAGLPRHWKLWVELPPGWNTTLGCSRADRGVTWQWVDPRAANHFGVIAVPDGVHVGLEVGWHKDLYGVGSRFGRVHSFRISGRGLEAGESFGLVFRHADNEGQFRAPAAGGSGEVRWLVVHPLEPLPDRHPVLAEAAPGRPRSYPVRTVELTLGAGPARWIEASLPSRAGAGEPVVLRVRLLDGNHHLVKSWPAPAVFEGTGPLAGVTDSLEPDETGVAEVQLQAAGEGVARVTVSVAGVGSAKSNPVEILPDSPRMKVYWGDLHSHSRISHDGLGADPFGYARYASALDFYALTEHSRHVTPEEWKRIQADCSHHHRPGRFVTLLAAEDSAFTPSGHFNLYFASESAKQHRPAKRSALPQEYGDPWPLVIPHHTGKQWRIEMSDFWLGFFNHLLGPHVDWKHAPDVELPAVEIYSLHGSSELYDPSDKLAYEHCDVTLLPKATKSLYCQTGGSRPGPHYARDGWAAGRVMGTVAGSDDHRSQPGRRGGGLTAVMAPELTREEIFEAIRARRTWATTGDRILIEFSIDGKPMGSVLPAGSPGHLKARALGTGRIETFTLWRFAWNERSWKAVKQVRPSGEEAVMELSVGSAPAVYYLRVDQEGQANGRPIRAWSSPIWMGPPGESATP
jgi:hypothetical protein